MATYPKFVNVEYLIHMSFHESKYTRYTVIGLVIGHYTNMRACICTACIHKYHKNNYELIHLNHNYAWFIIATEKFLNAGISTSDEDGRGM